ncbi:hypothetical protein [Kribbella sp. CA-294648]|uniref:hypothetical protein n=1 Tax=Kribbella sp. CA-294648 TaxID=3239948 RepID=UPI003D924588
MRIPFTVRPGATGVPIDWAAVEARLGLRLPTDYKELASAYGPLDIGEFIWLHVPCVQEGRFDYGDWLKETHRHCRALSRKVPPHTPPPFHPQPGGLLAWGTTRRSTYLFWDTSAADPDQWPVVAYDSDAGQAGKNPWQNFGLPLLDMLEATLRTGLELPPAYDESVFHRGDRRLGPLPPTAQRTAFLPNPESWTPSPPPPAEDPVRRTALTVGSGLTAVRQLVPPPTDPYLGDGSWEELFGQLGTRLPAQYVELLETYGSGSWSSWLNFFSPLPANTPDPQHAFRGLPVFATEILDIYRELRAAHPEFQPLAVWPEPGGFFPFAESVDGDALGWLTIGSPDDWPLIVYPRHYDQGPPLTTDLFDTLLGWLRGGAAPESFPKLDPDDDPLEYATFEPWRP